MNLSTKGKRKRNFCKIVKKKLTSNSFTLTGKGEGRERGERERGEGRGERGEGRGERGEGRGERGEEKGKRKRRTNNEEDLICNLFIQKSILVQRRGRGVKG